MSIYQLTRLLPLNVLIVIATIFAVQDSACQRHNTLMEQPGSQGTAHETPETTGIWLMGALALDVEVPNVGADYYDLGFSYHAGLTWDDHILLFANHAIRGSFSTGLPSEEHRYEYALLYGLNRRDRAGFLYAAAGLSYVDYSLRGAEQSGSTPMNPSFATVSGSAFGLGVSAGVYLTPVRGWGALGLGLHASFLHKHSFVAFEISLIELNILLSD